MTTPPPDTPWWAWLIGVIVTVGLPAIVALLVSNHRKVTAIKGQVENSHPTNMRDDMDGTRLIAEEAARDAKLSAESSHRTERLVEDLVRTIRATEHSADRRERLTADAIAEVRADHAAHLAEVPTLLSDAFAAHCAACKKETR